MNPLVGESDCIVDVSGTGLKRPCLQNSAGWAGPIRMDCFDEDIYLLKHS